MQFETPKINNENSDNIRLYENFIKTKDAKVYRTIPDDVLNKVFKNEFSWLKDEVTHYTRKFHAILLNYGINARGYFRNTEIKKQIRVTNTRLGAKYIFSADHKGIPGLFNNQFRGIDEDEIKYATNYNNNDVEDIISPENYDFGTSDFEKIDDDLYLKSSVNYNYTREIEKLFEEIRFPDSKKYYLMMKYANVDEGEVFSIVSNFIEDKDSIEYTEFFSRGAEITIEKKIIVKHLFNKFHWYKGGEGDSYENTPFYEDTPFNKRDNNHYLREVDSKRYYDLLREYESNFTNSLNVKI